MHVSRHMLKAVITTILLASSSAAMADTPYPYDHDDYGQRGDYNDQRDYTDQRGTQYRSRRPVLLADNVVLNPRSARPTWVTVDGRFGISRLKIQLQAGRTYVDNIVVVYADNHRETIAVRQWLSMRDPAVTIDLTHRGLQGIFIESGQQGRFARGGGWRRGQNATIDVIGIRR